MAILALNTGSSSLKFGLFDDEARESLVMGEIDWADGDREQAQLIVRPRTGPAVRSRQAVSEPSTAANCAIKAALQQPAVGSGSAGSIRAVGHRVVHGGIECRSSTLIDQRVKAAIGRFSALAPLHNPPALKAIEAAEAALPGVPQIAVFDTAFYAAMPAKARIYSLPYEWHQRFGICRFGFHGTSHAYCSQRAAQLLGRDLAQLRLVTCHLGGGCSATAVEGGRAVATTMGFSPLDGLMMGTRCGSIDPGLLIHLQQEHGLTLHEVNHALHHSSGLLGVSGISPDLARIEAAAARGDERARLAFDLFSDQVRSAIGGLAVTMGGLDVLSFTDRIGENSPALRLAVCRGLEFMGVRLDRQRNAEALPDADLALDDSPVRVLVIHTEEEWMVAREARRIVGGVNANGPP